MARVLFARGVRGEIIRRLQLRLMERGVDPKGVDGDYGDNTQKAVAAFQKASGVPQTGEVDPMRWKRLVGRPPPSVRERALQLTAAFEGHDYTLAQANFDGAGVTRGIIGFTLLHGSLGTIVLEIQRRTPALVQQAFGRNTDVLLEVVRGSKASSSRSQTRSALARPKARLAGALALGFPAIRREERSSGSPA